MNEMKRRVSSILDFISRAQIEMAATNGARSEVLTATTSSSSRTRTSTQSSIGVVANGGLTETEPLGGAGNGDKGEGKVEVDLDPERFARLSSVEMMEVLTRGLMKWQGEFGKVGEK